MSAFEKLPREIRDLIYERCLLFDGEIIPFPREHEIEALERRSQGGYSTRSFAGQRRMQKDHKHVFLGYPNGKGERLQTEHKPFVALLGVNSTIRDEAANILFGKNVWRLSSRVYVQDDRYHLWDTYAKYFRHVVAGFHAQDIDETKSLDISMGEMGRVEENSKDSDRSDQARLEVYHERLILLTDGFMARRDVIHNMNLKSLSFDFSDLFRAESSFRYEILQNFLECFGSIGPWYRLERERSRDLKTKPEADVKVLGLKNDEEKELFWETWGLKVN